MEGHFEPPMNGSLAQQLCDLKFDLEFSTKYIFLLW